ncbi:MAG: response regulator [Dissulfurimicrobium sp.]|uniref:response regulator n=1 Tax=Dissulfurimicrobium TaxID=1769732 RepID=UPI001EDA49BD|nr:response regulator [Dissulfurimicrobium hydrothermale]UKL14259.1 response regulator [Dissulfurimicrobium hydrothermale]
MARLLVVDDSSFMRRHLVRFLTEAGHKVVGQGEDGRQGFDLYKKLRPDFVIMDVTMRGTDGITGARMIRDYDPGARLVFISMISDPDVIAEAKRLGAIDFIGKDAYDRILAAVSGDFKGRETNGPA